MRKFCFFLILLMAFSVCGFAQNKTAKAPSNTDKQQIEALVQRYSKAFNAKDVNAIMANYAPGDQLFVFDVIPPRQYAGWDAYKKDFEDLFAGFPGPVTDSISELNITVIGPVAYSHRIESAEFTGKDGSKLNLVVRVTDVYRKIKGKWLIVQEHVSVPVDPMTGKADLLSKP
jgi:uncharacterized protein (TIGR02246 family)